MAEHPHAALVRKGYDAFTRGDLDSMRGLLAGDCTYHFPGSNALSGDYKGQDAVLDMFRRIFEETNGTLQAELRHVLVDGRGHAVSLHHSTAERRGKRIEQNGSIVFRIVGDKVTDLDECFEDLDMLNNFWS
ncbi:MULTISPECIES: nuclear transport factor 2 family protein [unclassified Streptomyces]|uniref:nuclear transport factor 2 family protein n=1 Tax=unclassified Streptomyces TaxID=2593676 RepID=UPI00236691E6|nr:MULTISPECIES: nuclear transport factor 2 family protein [unclassified Streptomyces]MDF3144626.1 nuclear transport factor 2 family protein [Streptomyces sp. T21Q-yed]WDF38020.1 nuclear transport factor 2 family protein [Streptomyces sp. T12]